MKPTIAQLQEILQRDDENSITILPNGEVEVVPGTDTGELKPITFRENLGGEYSMVSA